MRFVLWLVLLMAPAALAQPQRIIALAPHITEMLYAVGAGEQVVAVSDFSDYPDDAKKLPRVASYNGINIESVLALKPDLVIAWRTGNPQADIKRLQKFGIRVEYSDPLLLEDIGKELKQLGELTGHTEQGATIAAQFELELSALRAEYQQKSPVKVFFAMGTAPLSTVANNAWPQQMLQLCAAQNSFSDVRGDYPQVGIEQVIAAQPQVIIQPTRPDFTADFSFWQRFDAIPAVKQSQFLTVNADHLYRTTPRTLLGIRQLCQGVDAYR